MSKPKPGILLTFFVIALLQIGLYGSMLVRHHSILDKGELVVFYWDDVHLPDPQPGDRISAGAGQILLNWPDEVSLPEAWADTPDLYLMFESNPEAGSNPRLVYASEAKPQSGDAFLKAGLRHVARPDEDMVAGLLLQELRPRIVSITRNEKSAPAIIGSDEAERRFQEYLWRARLELRIYRGRYAVVGFTISQ